MIDPLLLDIPNQLETERLLLRVPRPGDGAMIYEAIMESLTRAACLDGLGVLRPFVGIN